MQKAITDQARWSTDAAGTWISFRVTPQEAAAMAQMVDSAKEYELTVKLYHKKRSLSANGYFWTLLDQLSAVLGIPPLDIYREYIPHVGGNSVIARVQRERHSAWERIWCEGHKGRVVESLGASDIDGYDDVQCFFGSSDYDSAQMARLIDLAVADCKEVGIETMTPDEQAKLLAVWDERSRDG